MAPVPDVKSTLMFSVWTGRAAEVSIRLPHPEAVKWLRRKCVMALDPESHFPHFICGIKKTRWAWEQRKYCPCVALLHHVHVDLWPCISATLCRLRGCGGGAPARPGHPEGQRHQRQPRRLPGGAGALRSAAHTPGAAAAGESAGQSTYVGCVHKQFSTFKSWEGEIKLYENVIIYCTFHIKRKSRRMT